MFCPEQYCVLQNTPLKYTATYELNEEAENLKCPVCSGRLAIDPKIRLACCITCGWKKRL